MRRFPSTIATTIAAAGLVLALAGCSGAGSTNANGASTSCTAAASGSTSDSVKVTGDFGKEPKVTFKKPLTSTKTQRTVVSSGKGQVAEDGDAVTLDYAVYNATSGKQLYSTGFTGSSAVPGTLNSGSLIPGLYKEIKCTPAGSRVVAVMPPADAFGDQGASAGVGPKESIVVVLDLVSAKTPPKALKKANGTPQKAPAGYPTVTLAKNGAPTITVPKTAAPAALEIADLKKGKGATVKDGASVTVQYTGMIWDTGKVFDSSWAKGQPATFTTSGVIPGFGKALVGQKVGSQVIAIIPPADGYVGGNAQAGISATDTLVFVVDILATQ